MVSCEATPTKPAADEATRHSQSSSSSRAGCGMEAPAVQEDVLEEAAEESQVADADSATASSPAVKLSTVGSSPAAVADAPCNEQVASSADPSDIDARVRQLEKEKAELQSRLEFVEELVGPTEAQRKELHEQLVAARAAALKAKCRGASLPTKVAGRLDEMLLWSRGLSERDAGLLQGGCLPDCDGILQDVSMLGDPNFHPYNERTGELKWQARGGVLQLSLDEVSKRFGEDVAHDVVRCAKELDKYDASRRVGVELPWHPVEDRELEPAEVINLMDQELALAANLSYVYHDEEPLEQLTGDLGMMAFQETHLSPYAAVNAPPPPVARSRAPLRAGGSASAARGQGGKRSRQRSRASGRSGSSASAARPAVASAQATGAGNSSARGGAARRIYGAPAGGGAVVPLPRVEATVASGRRGSGPHGGAGSAGASGGGAHGEGAACTLPGLVRRPRMQEPLQHPLLGCIY
eukprot:TRINITY_DN33396_c0_g1_i1.p1 TRINITY_DN33396_c0_g1~~TRINITY_DN33396_c0_g1_i1.p1  ORF type:complete len:467 (+),score=87.67 TRINITY_DN33396_c0_g1_i1:149-1549(+)